MNALIASILGRGPVREDATSVPVPAIAQRAKSRRERARAHRTVAAILGMSEAEEEEELIPDDAVEIDNILGAPGVDVDDRASQVAKAPTEPALPNYGQGSPEPLMTPAVALVAPDVTPEALKPLDASQVPKGDQPIAAQPMAPEPIQPEDESDPLHKILAMARSNTPAAQTANTPLSPPSHSAESMLAAITPPGDAAARAAAAINAPMLEHKKTDGSQVMAAFSRFQTVPTWTRP
jgi:hypothetical protein